MSLFSRADAIIFRDAAKEAYTAALRGERYQIKDRSLRRQSLKELKKALSKWSKYVQDIDAGLDPDNSVTTKRIQTVGM